MRDVAELRRRADATRQECWDLVKRHKADMRRAQQRAERASETLRRAVDLGYGTFWDTDEGTWRPRTAPLVVTVVDTTEQDPVAFRRLWGCDPSMEAAA